MKILCHRQNSPGIAQALLQAELWRATLESYEQPPMDDAVRAALEEYVVRRRAELGD